MKKNNPELLKRYKAGDKAAWELLFKNHYEEACYFAWTFLKEEAPAEDLVMDAFTRLWAIRDKFESLADVRFKLFSEIKFKAFDALKIKSLEPITRDTVSLMTDEMEEEEKVGLQMDRTMLIREIYVEIKKLSPGYQEVIKRFFLHGQTVNEIARDLNLKHNTVITSRERGIKILKARLGNRYNLGDIEQLIFISLLLLDPTNFF